MCRGAFLGIEIAVWPVLCVLVFRRSHEGVVVSLVRRWKGRVGGFGAGMLVLVTFVTVWPCVLGAPEFVADGRFHLGGVALGLSMLLLLLRTWRSAAVVAVVSLVHLAPAIGLHFGNDHPGPVGHSLTVGTSNVWCRNHDADALRRVVKEEGVDIIALVEVSPEIQAELSKNPLLPYQEFVPVTAAGGRYEFSMGLASRYPWAHLDRVILIEGSKPILRASLDVDGDLINIYVVHAPPPKLGEGGRRAQYLNEFSKRIDASRPTLLLGDLNATLYAPGLKRLLDHSALRDSREGFGRQPSWAPEGWPIVAGFDIDHILVSRHFWVDDRWVGSDIGSDHRPAFATVRLAERSE